MEEEPRSGPTPMGAALGEEAGDRELDDSEVLELLAPLFAEMGVDPANVKLIREDSPEDGPYPPGSPFPDPVVDCDCIICALSLAVASEVRDITGITSASALEPTEPPAPSEPPSGFSFGEALELLEQGAAMARSGWNGKGMFIYHVPAGNYPAKSLVAKAHWGEETLVPYRPYLAIKSVDGMVVPWLASQTDLLAKDWALVNL